MVLFQLGRIEIASNSVGWIRQTLANGMTAEAVLTHEIGIHSRTIGLPHNDPADRFLVGTALVKGLAFATADRNLLELRSIQTIANR